MKNLFLLSLLLLLTNIHAWACSCVGENIPEKHKIAKSYMQASLVLVGKVLKAETITSTDTVHVRSRHSGLDTVYTGRRAVIRYTFAVSELLKGEIAAPTVVVESAQQSSACGVTFAVGSEQLIYASTATEVYNFPLGKPLKVAPHYTTSLCQRHQALRDTKTTELRQLRQIQRKASGEHKVTWFELLD